MIILLRGALHHFARFRHKEVATFLAEHRQTWFATSGLIDLRIKLRQRQER
jgi:hypothetical protein